MYKARKGQALLSECHKCPVMLAVDSAAADWGSYPNQAKSLVTPA